MCKRHRLNEHGTGVVGTMFGAIVFLAFLVLAAHVLIGLHARSVMTAVMWDETRRVATHQVDQDQGTAELRRRLGGFHGLELDWRSDGNGSIGLHASADAPSLMPPALLGVGDGGRGNDLTKLSRTVWVREEITR